MWTMLALLAAGPASDGPGIGWPLAYTGYVKRQCDGWDQRLDDIPLDALPGPESMTHGSWSETGSELRVYREGLAAARAAQAKDPRFCERPLQGAGVHAPEVERLLVRVPPTR